MNGDTKGAIALAAAIGESTHPGVSVLICPPFPYLGQCAIAKAAGVQLGAQDCSPFASGAHTGDVSAAMLADLGCETVILGHSERRQDHGEGDGLIRAKIKSAHAHGLKVIACVGETLAERDAGEAEAIVQAQIEALLSPELTPDNIVIAYEPVWAIGTGKTATEDEIADMHAFIHKILREGLADGDRIAILYGGSVKPDNAKSILAISHVGGALIGGASLNPDDFNAIIEVAEKV